MEKERKQGWRKRGRRGDGEREEEGVMQKERKKG